jgi:iron-sulfur cluster repair protein YtfE (RIC family)
MTTQVKIDGDTTVNELVQRTPQVLPVLQLHGIDACCGGPLALREVAQRHGLDLRRLLEELGAR